MNTKVNRQPTTLRFNASRDSRLRLKYFCKFTVSALGRSFWVKSFIWSNRQLFSEGYATYGTSYSKSKSNIAPPALYNWRIGPGVAFFLSPSASLDISVGYGQKHSTSRITGDNYTYKTNITSIQLGFSIYLNKKSHSPKMSHFARYYIVLLCLLFPLVKSNAQKRFVISGYVSDAASGEKLNGATIMFRENEHGVISNDYGFFSLSVPKGMTTIIVSYIGYQNDTLKYNVQENRSVDVMLHRKNTLTAVEIKGTTPIEKRNDISTITLDMSQVNKLPSFLGEKDLLKAVQLLPGVQAGQEGNSGFYVRGGGPDENLILLDGVPVYNVSHLFGFVSVFTPEAVKSVKLIKGGFPARYGGRLSSILDIKMKEGDLKNIREISVSGCCLQNLLLRAL